MCCLLWMLWCILTRHISEGNTHLKPCQKYAKRVLGPLERFQCDTAHRWGADWVQPLIVHALSYYCSAHAPDIPLEAENESFTHALTQVPQPGLTEAVGVLQAASINPIYKHRNRKNVDAAINVAEVVLHQTFGLAVILSISAICCLSSLKIASRTERDLWPLDKRAFLLFVHWFSQKAVKQLGRLHVVITALYTLNVTGCWSWC